MTDEQKIITRLLQVQIRDAIATTIAACRQLGIKNEEGLPLFKQVLTDTLEAIKQVPKGEN